VVICSANVTILVHSLLLLPSSARRVMSGFALNECEPEKSNVHIVLLGDSTLDNGRYLSLAFGELSVGNQLDKRCEERGWQMTLLAQDGSMLEDVLTRQVPRIPASATHLVLSCTGNDLLALLNQMVVAKFAVSTVFKALGEGLSHVAERYRDLIQKLRSLKCHVACCTVYRPNFNHVCFKTFATVSLAVHNSRLLEIALALGCSVLDLASILEGAEDFANPLELSTRGGSKVIENVTNFVTEHPAMPRRRAPAVERVEMVFAEDKIVSSCALPRRCCRSGKVEKSVYASKAMSQALVVPCTHRTSGTLLGRPLKFSEAQQAWRET